MKRRSFLQAVFGAIAAVFAPSAASKTTQSVPAGFKPYHGNGGIVRSGQCVRPIFHGDMCILDGGKFRPLTYMEDDLAHAQLAVAVQGTDGRFTFAQFPECMDVEMDIEIRG